MDREKIIKESLSKLKNGSTKEQIRIEIWKTCLNEHNKKVNFESIITFSMMIYGMVMTKITEEQMNSYIREGMDAAYDAGREGR